MFHWMRAKKYRLVQPSILTLTSAAMVMQACFVPQLLAQMSNEAAAEQARVQALLDSELAPVARSHSSRVKQLHESMLDIAASLQKGNDRPAEDRALDHSRIEYIEDAVRDEFTSMQVELGKLRTALLTENQSVMVARLDAHLSSMSTQYADVSRQLAIVRRQIGRNPRALERSVDELVQRLRSILDDDQEYLPRHDREVQLPRRQSRSTEQPVSRAPLFDYPWQFASLDSGFVGEFYSLIDEIDLVDQSDGVDGADTEPNETLNDELEDLVTNPSKLNSDPVRIFEYVRNNVVYEPYFGSVKNASKTFKDNSGNDLDQANLLLNMLRTAGIPARFAYGTIGLDLDDAADWLGVSEPGAMVDVLRKGGVPCELRYEGNQPVELLTDHVWVTALVNVEPFRGADNGGVGDTWLDLDPSFKQHRFAYHDLASAISMNPSAIFINSQYGADISPVNTNGIGSADNLNDGLLLEELAALAEPVRSYLTNEGVEAESIYWQREIAEQRFGLFTISDEYDVVNPGVRTRIIPRFLTHRLEMTVYDSEGNAIDGFSLQDDPTSPDEGPRPISELAGDPIVLAYQVDESSRDLIVQDPSGWQNHAGALLRVTPEVRVGDNAAMRTGSDILFRPGGFHVVEFEFFPAGVGDDDVSGVDLYRQIVRAGGVHAFVLNAQQITGSEISEIQAGLDDLDLSTDGGFNVVTASVGKTLDAIGRTYFHQVDRYNQMTAGAMGVYATRLPSLARVSWDVVTPTPNSPQELQDGPVSVDIVRDLYSVTSRGILGDDAVSGTRDTSRFRLVSSILSNTAEVSSIKQVFVASAGTSANEVVKASVNDGPAGSSAVTVAPGANLGQLFGSGGMLDSLPVKMKNYMQDHASPSMEFLVLDDSITIDGGMDALDAQYPDRQMYALYAVDAETGNGSILQFDVDHDSFTSASVLPGKLFSTDAADDSSDIEIPGFLDLMYFPDPDDLAAQDTIDLFVNVLTSAEDGMFLSESAISNTALWYLPAIANVDEWFVARESLDPVTIPLSSLMLSQPIDQFVTEPAMLNFSMRGWNGGSGMETGWVIPPLNGSVNNIVYQGLASRSSSYTIQVFDPDGTELTDLTDTVLLQNPVADVIEPTFLHLPSIPGEPNQGVYSYRVTTTNGNDVSVPITGELLVDLNPPVGELIDPSTIDQELGSVRIEGTASDTMAFDRAELQIVDPQNGDAVVHAQTITQPRHSQAILAVVDTTNLTNGQTYHIRMVLHDVAGNVVDWNEDQALQMSFTVSNPPNPDDIIYSVVQVDPTKYLDPAMVTPAYTTFSSSSVNVISQRLGFNSLNIDIGRIDFEVYWPNFTDYLNEIVFSEVQVLVDGQVVHAIPVSPVDQQSSVQFEFEDLDINGVQYGRKITLLDLMGDIDVIAIPFSQLSSPGQDQELSLRLIPNIGDPAELSLGEFNIGFPVIEQFDVSYSYVNGQVDEIRVAAKVNKVQVLRYSGTSDQTAGQYWAIGIFSGDPDSDGFVQQWVPLNPLAYQSMQSATIDTPSTYTPQIGYFERDAVPNEFVSGTTNDAYVAIDLAIQPDGLFDGHDYHVQLMASRSSTNSTFLDPNYSFVANEQFSIDRSTAPVALIENLTDPFDVTSVADLENYRPTSADSGFFTISGYAYDQDPEQADIKYRIEFRNIEDAVLYPESHAFAADPDWVAVPSEDPQAGIWGVQIFSTDSDIASWLDFDAEGIDPYRQTPSSRAYDLATLDLTGLPDGEYEVALVVEVGNPVNSTAVDLGRLSYTSPAKVGRFTFSQEDISLQSTGFPTSLVRTYDTLDQNEDGPFGLGWSMEIFDLDVKLHETRVPLSGPNGQYPFADLDFFGDDPPMDLSIRNANMMDRSVSLTLPDGRHLTFPAYYRASSNDPGRFYLTYDAPAGYDLEQFELRAGTNGEPDQEYLETLLFGPHWQGDPFNAPEQHHDVAGWTLLVDGGDTTYTIKREYLHDSFVFLAEPGHSQATGIGAVWGEPYISRIKLPTGDVVHINTDNTGDVRDFRIQPLEDDTQTSSDDFIRFIYSDGAGPNHVIAAFGPPAPSDDSWAEPLFIYGYDNSQLTRVARVNTLKTVTATRDESYQWDIDTDCEDCDITTFEYDSASPGLIRKITDPRGLQPTLSEYDDSGRLVATIDAYGRRVEITRDVQERTEIVNDRGIVPAISTSYEYDELGNVVKEVHSNGKTIVREYDDENRITLEHDLAREKGTITDYIYEGGGVDLVRVTDPEENITETRRRDRQSGIPQWIETTQIVSGRDPIVTRQYFDSVGNLTESVSGNTRIVNEYDSRNRLEVMKLPEIVDGVPTGNLVERTKYEYNDVNPALLDSITQIGQNGETTKQHFRYDHLGRQYASYTIAADENGIDQAVIEYQEYDHAGRVVSTWRDIQLASGLSVASAGSVSEFGVRLTSSYYNSIDQVIASIDHTTGLTSTTMYDLRGNVIEAAQWATDFSNDAAYFEALLDWLEDPIEADVIRDAGDGIAPPTADVVVTRTAYNAQGNTQFTTDQFVLSSADYDAQYLSTDVVVSETVYDAYGRAHEQNRGLGKLELAAIDLDPQSPGRLFFTMSKTAYSSSVPLSRTTYDTLGRVARSESFTNNGSSLTEYFYDENDRTELVRLINTDMNGLVLDTRDTRYEYDEAGRQSAVIDPRGNRVEYEYDSEGRRTHTSYNDPQLGETTSAETVYDGRGRRIAEISQVGDIKSFSYDAEDRLSGVTLVDPAYDEIDQPNYHYEYNLRGDLTKITDPEGYETTLEYNHLGQRVSRELPTGSIERWFYDNDTSSTSPAASFGKVIYHQDFVGNVTEYVYDPAEHGRLTAKKLYIYTGGVFDPDTSSLPSVERKYTYMYDEFGRIEEVSRYDDGNMSSPDRVTAYEYDADGRLEKLYQPEGIIIYDYYEQTGRLKFIRTFDGDADNQATPGDGITTNAFEYDATGRLTKVTLSEGMTETGAWTYGYNEGGSRSAIEFSGSGESHATRYQYDTLGRLIKLEHTEGAASSPGTFISGYYYTHRADGRRASVDEVRQEEQGVGKYSHMRIDYEYDALGRLVSEVSAKGVPADRPSYITTGPPDADFIDHADLTERNFARTYSYDRAGNRVSKVTDYADNTLDEHVKYTYDPSSNQLTFEQAYPNLAGTGSDWTQEAYQYDPDGFMKKKIVSDVVGGSGSAVWTHDYTRGIEGRLEAYTRTDHAGPGTTDYAFDYNEDGIRVLAGTDDSSRRIFLVDRLNPTGYAQVLLERTGGVQGTVARKYAVGDDMLAQVDSTNGLCSLLADGHGSTRQLYDSGGSQWSDSQWYDYDAYGEVFHYELDDPGSMVSRPSTDLLYAGEQWDADLGMQYLRARYCLPGQGVFSRVDPFFGNTDDPQSLHKYVYTHGDPVNRWDPSGEISISEVTVAFRSQLSLVAKGLKLVSRGVQLYDYLTLARDLALFFRSGGVANIRSQLQTILRSWGNIQPGSKTSVLLDTDFWRDVSAVFAQNINLLMVRVLSTYHQTIVRKYAKRRQRPFLWLIYMPTPHPRDSYLANPSATVVLPAIRIANVGVALRFGGGGSRGSFRGRVLGLGVGSRHSRPSEEIQFFRMDYHEPHTETGGLRDRHYWTAWGADNLFHFHVLRSN